jgi:hypothetical protein
MQPVALAAKMALAKVLAARKRKRSVETRPGSRNGSRRL